MPEPQPGSQGSQPTEDDFLARNAHAFGEPEDQPATETEQPTETLAAKPEDAEAKAPGPEAATAEAKPADKAVPPEDDGELTGVFAKYGKEPDKLAKAYLDARRLASEKDLELAREKGRRESSEALRQQILEQPEKPKEQGRRFFEDTEATQILEQLADSEKSIEGLNTFAENLERRIESRATEKREQERAEEAKQYNYNVLFDRSKQILRERAEAAGDTATAKRFENSKYRVSDAEYLTTIEQLESEISFINENFRPGRDGRLSLDVFEKMKRLRDPDEYDNRLLQKGRVAALSEVEKANAGEKVLMPGATSGKQGAFKSAVDLNALAQDKAAFYKYLDSLPETEYDALMKRANLD